MKIYLVLILILFIIIVLIVLDVIADALLFFHDSIKVLLCFGSQKHDSNHPGITENTLFGKRDIVCPKCKCPLCTHVLISEKEFVFPFIPDKDKKMISHIKNLILKAKNSFILDFYVEEKYECKNCGYIF